MHIMQSQKLIFGIICQCPESKWDKVFEVNVKAPYMLSQDVYPYFQKRKGGSIIFISSIAGFFGFPVSGNLTLNVRHQADKI